MVEPDASEHPRNQTRKQQPRWRHRVRRLLRWVGIVLLILLVVVWWKVLRIQEDPSWPPPPDAISADAAMETTAAFLERDNPSIADIAIPLAPSTAADVQFFSDGTEFFPPILDDFAAAEQSIHILMFTMTPGEISEDVVAVLEDRLAAGVEVRFITDRYGGKVFSRSSELWEQLADAGAQIVVNDVFPLDYNGLLQDRSLDLRQDEVGNADHRKMLVVDGEIGWIGGAGFEDHFNGGRYHDTYTRVTGDVVQQMQLVYLTSFDALGGPPPSGSLDPYFHEPADPGTIPATLLHNVPVGHVPGTQAIREVIEDADNRLDILNPYVTDPGMVDRIVDAGERGADVTVVVPGESNVPQAAAALRYRYGELSDAGVEVFEHDQVIHAKVIIGDDRVVIGTINLDAWALYRNNEIALLVEGGAVADDARRVMIDDALSRSTTAEPSEGRWERLEAWFWDKLVYVL